MLQVLLRRPLRRRLAQRVVGHAEPARREQLLAVAVVRERPRLAHQPVDHVPVVDAVLAPATQPRQSLDHALARTRPPGARRTAAPRPARRSAGWAPSRCCRSTWIVLPGIHPHPHPLAALQPPRRQRPQHGQFLGQPLAAGRRCAGRAPRGRNARRPSRLAKSRLPRSISAWSTACLNRWWLCSTSPFSWACAGVDRLPRQAVVTPATPGNAA